MKKLIVSILVLGLTFCAAIAFAGDNGGYTFAIKGGYSFAGGDGNDLSGPQANTANNATKGNWDSDDGWLGAVAVGYDWSGMGVDMRTELEYTYYGSDHDFDAQNATSSGSTATVSGSIDNIQTLMLNAYYDFDTGTAWTPYVGAGLGMAFISADLDFSSNWRNAPEDKSFTETNFAWQVGAGIAYDITEYCVLDFNARYVHLGDVDYSENSNEGKYTWGMDDLNSFDTILGVRFTF